MIQHRQKPAVALLCAMNYAEVLGKLVRRRKALESQSWLGSLDLR
jgi:hypothetical protein